MMDVPILGYSDVNLSPKKSDRCVSDVSFIFSIKLILSHYFFSPRSFTHLWEFIVINVRTILVKRTLNF